MSNFNWSCPFCGHAAVIVKDVSYKDFGWNFFMANKHGDRYLGGRAIVCPNNNCREFTLNVHLRAAGQSKSGYTVPVGEVLSAWNLVPESACKVFPDYIPAPLLQDYKEACLIVNKSPKASATLSRRCLQGMIRDFHGIRKKRLVDEIDAIKDRVDSVTWDAIDALRQVGNIGAHMEQDINFIVDVDPGEAELLIELLETLFEEWYIRRHDRAMRMERIKTIAEEKDAAKKQATQGPAIEDSAGSS